MTARRSSTARSRSVPAARRRLAAVATVVDGGQPVEVPRLTEDLYDRGVRRLMVEGGGRVHTQFLTTGIADELHLVVAPFFVGTSRARRFVGDGAFPWNPGHRAHLAETRQIGDVVLLRYALSSRFDRPPRRGPRAATSRPPATDPPRGPAAGPAAGRVVVAGPALHLRRAPRRTRARGAGARRPGGRRAGDPRRCPLVRLHSECLTGDVLRQRAVRLRPAAAGGGRPDQPRSVATCSTCARRAVASVSTTRSTPTPCRTPDWTPTRPTSRSASARTSATTPSPPRCCSAWAWTGSTCSPTTPTRRPSSRPPASASSDASRPGCTCPRSTAATSPRRRADGVCRQPSVDGQRCLVGLVQTGFVGRGRGGGRAAR